MLTKNAVDKSVVKILSARILAKRGKLDEAIKVLNEANDPSREANELKSQLIAANSQNGTEVEKLLAENPSDPTLLSRLCSLYRAENPAKALEYCRQASELEPRSIDHAIGYGAALVPSCTVISLAPFVLLEEGERRGAVDCFRPDELPARAVDL